MKPTNILLENDDIDFIRSQGYSLSYFIRLKIKELREEVKNKKKENKK